MDLLDNHLCQTRNTGKTYRRDARQNAKRYAPTVLLDGLFAPRQINFIGELVYISDLTLSAKVSDTDDANRRVLANFPLL
jgi:hypothetical protein